MSEELQEIMRKMSHQIYNVNQQKFKKIQTLELNSKMTKIKNIEGLNNRLEMAEVKSQ